MIEILHLKNKEDYFKNMSDRQGNGVYFCRFIGFDDDTNTFYKKYQLAAQKKGVYIKKPLNNPTETEVDYFYKTIGNQPFSLNAGYIKKAVDAWLNGISPGKRELFYSALLELLQERSSQGLNANILKNAFVKFMCWSRYVFEGVLSSLGEDIPPKILYEGDISKYEVYMLRILSRAGCDVLYVHFTNEDSYLKTDLKSIYSQAVYCKRRGIPPIHFTAIDIAAKEREAEMQRSAEVVAVAVETNTWLSGSFLEETFKKNNERGVLGSSKIYNLFVCYLGIDQREEYQHRLYQWKMQITESGKPLVFVEGRFGNPSIDEVKKVRPITYKTKEELCTKLAIQMDVAGNPALTSIVQGAFYRTLMQSTENTLSKLYNDGVKLLCWFARYAGLLFKNDSLDCLPVFFYFGKCNASELEFLTMLSAMPVDVVIATTDKQAFQIPNGKVIVEELPQSEPVFSFPKKEPKVRVATAAYSAERELDTLLYTGTGLFRNRQFVRSNPVTLKTTYEEIGILWKEEAKYRPGFEATAGRVVVPNIFAKVCGMREADASAYFRKIEGMLTDKTIFIKKIPYITADTENTIKPHVHKFFQNGEILPAEIKKHKEYKFDYLSEDTQDYILEKLQQMIDLKWIKADTMGLEYAIIATVLNLDKYTVRLLQQFDFTKEIPKVVIIDTDESMFSLEDCIYLLFLNLVGFDIIVFTPTGYRNLEKYIAREAYEEYQAGPYAFNLIVPQMRVRRQDSGGEATIWSKLFGKGRN